MTTKRTSKVPISSHYFVKVLYRTDAVQDFTLQKRSRHPLFELLCLRQLNEKLASDPLAKHPTTGAAIVSPSVAMNQSFGKQANVLRYKRFKRAMQKSLEA